MTGDAGTIDRLINERDAARAQYVDLMALKDQVDAERDALRARCEALERDRERLDWLINWLSIHDGATLDGPYAVIRDWSDNEDARAAIDAARAQSGEGRGA